MDTFQSDRTFQLWAYSPSHGQVLLRSPKSGAQGRVRNIDVLFLGVAYIDIPVILRGLRITRSNDSAIAQIAKRTGLQLSEQPVFSVGTQEGNFAIVAAHFRVEENDLEMFDVRLEGPSK